MWLKQMTLDPPVLQKVSFNPLDDLDGTGLHFLDEFFNFWTIH